MFEKKTDTKIDFKNLNVAFEAELYFNNTGQGHAFDLKKDDMLKFRQAKAEDAEEAEV